MLEFPSSRNSWRLDIVSILAVLGESNIKVNAHLITASRTCLLPRLMPAPQGLLAEKRMKRLPLEEDIVSCIGVHSGHETTGSNYFATIFHGTGVQAMYSVREFTIAHRSRRPQKPTFLDRFFRGQPAHAIRLIRPLWISPTNIIAVFSCALSIGLLIWAALLRDGVAVIGIVVMSGTAPILCAGTRYWLPLPRASALQEKSGDVIIRTRDDTFTVVHCDEMVALQLYFLPEIPKYYMEIFTNRLTGGVVGGLMLVVSIALFGNCTWTMQAALSVTYALLNVLYWVAASLPERYSWDFFGLEITEEHTSDNETFTEALWVAIQRSGSVGWVKASRSVPDTPVWDKWLAEADRRLQSNSREWDANEAFSKILEAQTPMMPERGGRATTEPV